MAVIVLLRIKKLSKLLQKKTVFNLGDKIGNSFFNLYLDSMNTTFSVLWISESI